MFEIKIKSDTLGTWKNSKRKENVGIIKSQKIYWKLADNFLYKSVKKCKKKKKNDKKKRKKLFEIATHHGVRRQ